MQLARVALPNLMENYFGMKIVQLMLTHKITTMVELNICLTIII
jgi:hypothetical protein